MTAALRLLLEEAEAKLRQMGQEFSRPNFTDRYGDGPKMLGLAARLREELDAE